MAVTPATLKRRAAHRARLAELGIAVDDKPKVGRSKFHNVKATYNGQTYDSSGEAEYARKLDLAAKAGTITDWERPKPIPLAPCGKCLADTRVLCRDAKGLTQEAIHKERLTYRPDFYVIGAKPTVEMLALPSMPTSWYVDYKGGKVTETYAFRMKVTLWKLYIPHELRVVYKDGSEKVVCTGNEAIWERLNAARIS